MNNVVSDYVNRLLEIELVEEENFLKVKETLTRIGVASKKDNTLYQSCHILHKKQKFYIVHFKEMFILDGKSSDINDVDIARRNTIAKLLEDWGLVKIVEPEDFDNPTLSISEIKIIPFSKKSEWNLVPKYSIGKK